MRRLRGGFLRGFPSFDVSGVPAVLSLAAVIAVFAVFAISDVRDVLDVGVAFTPTRGLKAL